VSTRLFWLLAVVAVVATVAGVLVLRSSSGGSDSSGSVSGSEPVPGTPDPALEAKMRRLVFYDWEPNVIGPDSRPAPDNLEVTGGANAGRAGSLPLYDAVLRAARRPARVEPDNARTTTLFYAVDGGHRRVFGRGAPSRAQALAAVPAAPRRVVRVYEVRPDTTIVAAEGSRRRWYVLKDDVALRGSEIRDPRRATDPIDGRQVVNFAFTDAGRARFKALTQALAHRGAASSLNRVKDDPAAHNQHFAVVSGAQLVTVPFIDFRRNPDGLDARAGSQLVARLP
jgi:SecD/SecF fusion protein